MITGIVTERHYFFTLNRLFGRHRQPYVDVVQADWPMLVQISDLAGAYGVSFVVMAVAAAIARTIPIEMAGKLYGRGNFVQAERVCRQIIQSRPANADAHNIRGVSLLALGKKDEAVEEVRRAITLNPSAPSYHANLGEVLRQSGKLEEAQKPLKEAIRLDPKNAQALNNLGIISYELKRFKDAIDHYRQSLMERVAREGINKSKIQVLEALLRLRQAAGLGADLGNHLRSFPELRTRGLGGTDSVHM